MEIENENLVGSLRSSSDIEVFPLEIKTLSVITASWASYPDTQNCGLRMRRECQERFPATAG